MPWSRRGDKRVFYRSVRLDSRPRTIYVGTGPAAEAVAAEVEARKAARLAHREALAALTQAYEQAVAPLLQLDAQSDKVLHEAMTAAGFYRHDRGAWRRRGERRVRPESLPD
jgi:hypothetical protein